MSRSSSATDGARRSGRKAHRQPPLPVLTGTATVLASALLAGEAEHEHMQMLIAETAATTNLDRDTAAACLYALAMRDKVLLEAEPTAALHAQLSGLLLFTFVHHASLWLVDRGEERCLARAGETVAGPRLRAAARAAVNDARRPAGSDLRAVPVMRHGAPIGALVVRPRAGRVKQTLTYAGEMVRAVCPILERSVLLERTVGSGKQLLEAAERRIARLGFDIHDGPLQGLAIVAGELSVLNRQLEEFGDGAVGAFAERRLEDVKALVIDLGVDLRTIASSATPGRLYLRETLEHEVARLKRLTAIRVELDVDGDIDATTPSQRIAATRVVEEALANIREHSDATRVQVSVRRESGLLKLRIVDNGRGFDVARAMRRASRDRRLGLIAMEQRLRLLGGQFEVTSRPGGPTVISGSLPAWETSGSANGKGRTKLVLKARDGNGQDRRGSARTSQRTKTRPS